MSDKRDLSEIRRITRLRLLMVDPTNQPITGCGRAFDPSDPRTMSLGRPLRGWRRWLLRPLGWPSIASWHCSEQRAWRPSATGRTFVWSMVDPADEFRWPSACRTSPFRGPDWIFYASAGLWLAFTGSLAFRTLRPGHRMR